ncbi:unnamed protein product [Schistosoma curassoni]|uniref:Uncharacterized protein n=1 Tax=Schistosoma curassoni TaxID=6186 RepID=A0A183KHT2_9TREM|nr:unnamed protein product [Schistosoma curassoni]
MYSYHQILYMMTIVNICQQLIVFQTAENLDGEDDYEAVNEHRYFFL